MTEKRLIVDEDYNWVDTVTGYKVEIEDAFDLVNKLAEENEQLKSHINDTQIAVEIETEKCMNNVFDCIDSLCERADKMNRSNEFKWGAIMGLKQLKRELKSDVE